MSKKWRISSELNKNGIHSLEKGASSWQNAILLNRNHVDLTKSEYRDIVDLRNDRDPVKML